MKNQVPSTTILLTFGIALIGCHHDAALLDVTSARKATDDEICEGYNYSHYDSGLHGKNNPALVAEVMRRRLDCTVEGRARAILSKRQRIQREEQLNSKDAKTLKEAKQRDN